MKLVKVVCKKKDNNEMPEKNAFDAFQKKCMNSQIKSGHWFVYFWPDDFKLRTVRVEVQGPMDFTYPFGAHSVSEMKKYIKIYKDAGAELEKNIAYAEKKGKELEKEFKALPSEEK